MSTQVLNLPLTRQAYKEVEEGERIVSLPNTHHTLRKLYQSDGLLTPKPYKRANNLLEHIEHERSLLWDYMLDDLDNIFRETRRLLDPVNEGESSSHLKCEAWRLELYCLLLIRLFNHFGRPKSLVEPVNDGVQAMYRMAVNFSEGQGLQQEIMDNMVDRVFAKLLTYRQYSVMI